MKNTRKILTLVLSLALLVAGFTVSAFADTAEASTTDYSAALESNGTVLEFFEAGSYFEMRVDEYGDIAIYDTDEGMLLEGGAFDATVEDGYVTFTSVSETKIVIEPYDPVSFGINVRAKITEASPLDVCVVSSLTGDYLSLFSVSVGSISHKFDPATLSYVTESLALAADEFFELNLFVEKSNGTDTVYYTITTEGGATASGSYSYDNTSTDFIGGKFDFDGAYLATSAATVDFVEVYPGSYQRYVDNSKNVDVIAEKIAAAYTDYLAFKAQGAFELAEIIANVAVLYEYPAADIADADVKATVNTAFAECVAVVSKAYESEITAALATMQGADYLTKPYNDRLDTANTIIQYMEYMNGLQLGDYAELSGVDFEKVNGAFESAFLEAIALYEIEMKSMFVIEVLDEISNIYLATYEELKIAYETISEIEICDTYYSEYYSAEEVAEAVYKRNIVITNYPLLDAKAKAFVAGVTAAADMNSDFSSRYSAYVSAKKNLFTDDTYDMYLTGTTVAELNEVFAEIDAEMRAVSEVAEAFLAKIREAEQTPSYTVKIKALDEAMPYIEIVETGYPEVAAAIESYSAMRADVTARQDAARRYIQAVLNVQIASTVKSKLAAIEIAESFAVLGNESSVDVEGMSMTVTEANIVLSNEKAAITLKATRINNYVSAVDEIANLTDLLARRQAINNALTLKAGLTELAEEEDVVAATEDLNAAITAYNADVNAANDTAEATETAALTIVAKTVPAKRIAQVVAIVKKFYE